MQKCQFILFIYLLLTLEKMFYGLTKVNLNYSTRNQGSKYREIPERNIKSVTCRRL